jgi:hypothetical protein
MYSAAAQDVIGPGFGTEKPKAYAAFGHEFYGAARNCDHLAI